MPLCQQPAHCTPLGISSTKLQSENRGTCWALSPEVTVSIAFGIIMFLLAAYGLWHGRQRLKWKSNEVLGLNSFCFADFCVDDKEIFFSEWPKSSKRSCQELELGSEKYFILCPRSIPAATMVRLLIYLVPRSIADLDIMFYHRFRYHRHHKRFRPDQNVHRFMVWRTYSGMRRRYGCIMVPFSKGHDCSCNCHPFFVRDLSRFPL